MHFLFILFSLCKQTHHLVDVIQARITNWEVRFSCACCFERGMGSNWLMAFTSGSNPVCSPKLTSQKLRESSAVIGSMFFKQLKPSWTSRMDNQVYQAAQSSEVIYFSIVLFRKKKFIMKECAENQVPCAYSLFKIMETYNDKRVILQVNRSLGQEFSWTFIIKKEQVQLSVLAGLKSKEVTWHGSNLHPQLQQLLI